MKWKWSYLYMAIGGAFVVKLVENGRINALIYEAHQIREKSRKSILLISTKQRDGFDAYINPAQTVAWQLPYLSKSFGAVVSDSLEDIQYPQDALREWQRIADTVLVHTHSIFSPEAWLDIRHHNVFLGEHTIPVNPSLNWAIGGGVIYYLYKKGQRKKLELPEAEDIIEELTEEEPLDAEEAIEELTEDIPRMEGGASLPASKALPPPIDGVKIERAPILNPDELKDLKGGDDLLTGIDINSGVNLGIGSDGEFAEALEGKGVTNLIFNPLTMPQEHNQAVMEKLDNNPADSATLTNVLSKVSNPVERQGAVQVAYENIRPGGRVFIKDKNPKKYLHDVKQFFPNAKVKGEVIVATKK